MKIQDILFFIILLPFIYKKKTDLPVLTGLVLLLVAIVLFATWTFFTAERFTFYAAAFFLLSIILRAFVMKKE